MRIALIAGLLAVSCVHERAQPTVRLSETSWLLVEIDGQATELSGDLLADDRYAVDFGPNAVVGYSGCNRFSGPYTRAGDMLTFGPLGGTRRACAPHIMLLESRFFEILARPVRVSFPEPGIMLLTGETGAIRLRLTRDWSE